MSRPNDASRRRLLGATAQLGLLTLLGTAFAGRALAAGNTGDGSISLIKGQVFVNGTQAARTTPIPANAEVRTGARSMVAFSAGGDAHVMKANSSIVMRTNDSGFTGQLRLLTGSLLSAWGKRLSSEQAQLVTKTATIGIRGTVTYCEGSKFSLRSGAVSFQGKDGKTQSLDTGTSGKPVNRDGDGKPTKWQPQIDGKDFDALKKAAATLTGSTGNQLKQEISSTAQTNTSTSTSSTGTSSTDSLSNYTATGGSGGSASP